MDTKKLRQKILDLAIHGRLVPQDPSDEPAAELLKRINPKAEIISQNTDFQSETYPNSWVLTTIESINSYKSHSVNPMITPEEEFDLYSVPIFPTQMPEHNKGKEIGSTKQLIQHGDILLCKINPHLNRVWEVSQQDNDMPKIASSEWIVIRSPHVCSSYLRYFFESENFRQLLCSQVSGVGGSLTRAQPAVVKKYYVPLPPLPEQHRIVAEIEKWFALIDQIEQGKASLQTTIKQTKSKILDLAIHGRLVPQDPNDEPAIELLKRINPGFAPCDNGHDKKLPQNWTWAKGTNIFLPMKSTKPKDEQFQYIDIDSIDNKRQIISGIKTIKTINAPSRASRYIQKNDVIFSMVRPYLRNIAKVNKDNCIASTGFYVCSPNPRLLNSDYCFYLMISDYVVNGLNQFMKGDNSPSINKVHIDEWLFPLPPLPEQHRIAAKIEELFSALDNIQNALEA